MQIELFWIILRHINDFFYKCWYPSSWDISTYKIRLLACIAAVFVLCLNYKSQIFMFRSYTLVLSYFVWTVTHIISLLCFRVLGERYKLGVILCGALLLTLYVYHTYYLAMIKFDYGYNMKVNIAVGKIIVIECYFIFHF